MTDAAPAKPANPRHKWYIVNAYSNFEKKVAEQLRDQAKQQGLEDAFSEILVPTEDVVEIRRGRKVNSERKFFPGYVLVKMEMTDQAYHLVKNTPKVTGFLGAAGGTKPLPVSEREVQNIIGAVEEGVERPKPTIRFDIGEKVKVIDGPFASFDGSVESVDEEHARLRVAVSIFGRATPVELEYAQVEKVAGCSRRTDEDLKPRPRGRGFFVGYAFSRHPRACAWDPCSRYWASCVLFEQRGHGSSPQGRG